MVLLLQEKTENRVFFFFLIHLLNKVLVGLCWKRVILIVDNLSMTFYRKIKLLWRHFFSLYFYFFSHVFLFFCGKVHRSVIFFYFVHASGVIFSRDNFTVFSYRKNRHFSPEISSFKPKNGFLRPHLSVWGGKRDAGVSEPCVWATQGGAHVPPVAVPRNPRFPTQKPKQRGLAAQLRFVTTRCV